MTAHNPLAELLRPAALIDVIGQSHLLAEGKPLRMALAQKMDFLTTLNAKGLG